MELELTRTRWSQRGSPVTRESGSTVPPRAPLRKGILHDHERSWLPAAATLGVMATLVGVGPRSWDGDGSPGWRSRRSLRPAVGSTAVGERISARTPCLRRARLACCVGLVTATRSPFRPCLHWRVETLLL